MINRLNIIYLVIALIAANNNIYSQCACAGGASIGGATPVGSASNIGVLKKHALRFNLLFKHSYGEGTYSHDIKLDEGDYHSFSSDFLSFTAGFGLSEKLTLEAELGYFADKTLEYWYAEPGSREILSESRSGLSHISLLGKYNLYHDIEENFEFTAAGGIKAPLSFPDDIDLFHIHPSTRAYSFILQSFLYKGFEDYESHLFLINRFEYNTKNDLEYKYGSALYTSLIGAKELFEDFLGIIEIRNEYRQYDEYGGKRNDDSGGFLFFLSPQLNYTAGSWNFSAVFDIPFYNYYFGEQLANKFSVGLNMSWLIEKEREKTEEEIMNEQFYKDNYGQ